MCFCEILLVNLWKLTQPRSLPNSIAHTPAFPLFSVCPLSSGIPPRSTCFSLSVFLNPGQWFPGPTLGTAIIRSPRKFCQRWKHWRWAPYPRKRDSGPDPAVCSENTLSGSDKTQEPLDQNTLPTFFLWHSRFTYVCIFVWVHVCAQCADMCRSEDSFRYYSSPSSFCGLVYVKKCVCGGQGFMLGILLSSCPSHYLRPANPELHLSLPPTLVLWLYTWGYKCIPHLASSVGVRELNSSSLLPWLTLHHYIFSAPLLGP